MTTISDTECRNADETMCDCGNTPEWKVPVDLRIAHDVYGYDDPGGFIKVCHSCKSDMECTGYLAGVYDQVQRLDRAGNVWDRGEW